MVCFEIHFLIYSRFNKWLQERVKFKRTYSQVWSFIVCENWATILSVQIARQTHGIVYQFLDKDSTTTWCTKMHFELRFN